MLTNFKNHIDQHFPQLKHHKILLACSGGIDSMVLAHLFKRVGIDFLVAHCNFKLRGLESDQDEDFVKKWAKQHNIKLFTIAFQTKKYADKNGISIQMAARNLRYEWFYKIASQNNIDYIATAHHLDDDFETFLINLSRGSGIKGLTAIPAINHKIIRPVLPFSRKEIVRFAKEQGIRWREDSSNKTTDYLRNALRHILIPRFKEITPHLTQNFKKTKQHLTQTQSLVKDYIALIHSWVVVEKDHVFYIDIEKLSKLPNHQALLYELLLPFGFSAWEDIFNLLKAQSGKYVVSKHFRVLKDRSVLIISPLENNDTSKRVLISKETNELSKPIFMRFETVSVFEKTNPDTVFIDKSLLKYPLTLRKWQEGDYFYPFGMNGKKKLSKFFKDEKLSLAQKEKIWVLETENKIVWIVGYRLDNRFKVTEKSHEILKIAVKL